MPSLRGHANIVEVRPSTTSGIANIAPSTPPASPSTKKARFASTLVEGVTRPLTPTEAWSLWHFETHARACTSCYDPLSTFAKAGRLCSEGHALAQDVAEHVYFRAGDIYSKDASKADDRKPVRVELQPGYEHVRGLLQAMDRTLRSRARTVPIVSYDRTYPVQPRRHSSPSRRQRDQDDFVRQRRSDDQDRSDTRRDSVIVEPATSLPSRRRTAHKTTRYRAVAVEPQPDVPQPAPPVQQPTSTERKPESRKGLLYDADVERRKRDKAYVVEIREPSSRNRDREREREREGRRREEGRRTGYYYG